MLNWCQKVRDTALQSTYSAKGGNFNVKHTGAFFRDPSSVKKPTGKDDVPFDPDAPFDLPPLPEKEITTWLESLNSEQKSKLNKIVKGKTQEMGYQSCRQGGTVWQRAEALAASDLIRREIDLDEIELN